MGQNAVKLATRPDRVSRAVDRPLRPEVLRPLARTPFLRRFYAARGVRARILAKRRLTSVVSKQIFVPSQTGCRGMSEIHMTSNRMILSDRICFEVMVVNIP